MTYFLLVVFLLVVFLGVVPMTLCVGKGRWEGQPIEKLREGEIYILHQKWHWKNNSSFLFFMKGRWERSCRFYFVPVKRLRDQNLKEIEIEKVPQRFQVEKEFVNLPEDLPSLKRKEVYILHPV